MKWLLYNQKGNQNLTTRIKKGGSFLPLSPIWALGTLEKISMMRLIFVTRPLMVDIRLHLRVNKAQKIPKGCLYMGSVLGGRDAVKVHKDFVQTHYFAVQRLKSIKIGDACYNALNQILAATVEVDSFYYLPGPAL